MAEAPARGEEEAGPRPALDVAVAANGPFFAFTVRVRIADWPLAAGALVGVGVAAIALGAFYNRNPELVAGAVRGALEGPGLQVANISPGSIIVELFCNMKDSFLSFLEDFESNNVKQRLEEEFKKIGYKEELEVTIANDEEVSNKLHQIRQEKDEITVTTESGVGRRLSKLPGPILHSTYYGKLLEKAAPIGEHRHSRITKGPQGKGLEPMALSKDLTGWLLADVLQQKPGLIEQLALCLDRERKLIPNWKQLSWELNVDPKVITRLQQYTDFSPTTRLFEHLEVLQPDLSILQLKTALSNIGRNDLFTLLTKAGCIDSETVQEAITSRNIEAHSPRADLLDDIALKLDDQSPVLANWSSLAARLGVPRKTFKQFERRSVQSPIHNMFEYLAVTRPHMTLKAVKDAFELMNRNDLLKILRNQNLGDEVTLKDVMTPGSELLQMVADKLNINPVPWTQNWRNLAYHLEIPSDLYQEFDESSGRRTSPTKEVMRWLTVRSPEMTLIDIVKALDKIRRNDAIKIVTETFPDAIDSSLKQPDPSSNNNSSLELLFDSTDKTLPSPCERRECISPRQEARRELNLSGSLPGVPHELIGREQICEQIITTVMSDKAVEIWAPLGYGKTSVVTKAAQRMIARGKSVVYVNPRGVTCVEDLGSKIIEALGEHPGDHTIEECLYRIRSLKNKTVLIIENLDNLLYLEKQFSSEKYHQEEETSHQGEKYCSAKVRGHFKKEEFLSFVKEIGESSTIQLVLTSTEPNDFLSFPIDLIKLPPLSKEDSSTLFKAHNENLDENTVDKLVDVSGCIPLIIFTVMSLLKYEDPEILVERLTTYQGEDLIRELTPKHLSSQERIFDCLEEYFGRLSEDDQYALVMLSTFPDRFTQTQLFAVFQSLTDFDLASCLRSLKFSSFLLFERANGRYCLPSYIRTFCSAKPRHAEAKSLFLRHYSDLVVKLSKDFLTKDSKSAVERYRDEKYNVKEAMVWCGNDHPELAQDLREKCIDAFNKAAVFLAKVMRKQEFTSLFRKLAHKCRYDPERYSACLTAIGMKIVLSCMCKTRICRTAWHQAKHILSIANDYQERLESVDDATRAQCLSKLGFCWVREGYDDLGFACLNQALALRTNRWKQSSKDKDKVMLAACRNDLAASLMLKRNHLGAIQTRRDLVLPVYEAILGNHPFVATTLSWIGKSYHELGDYDNAISFAAQALNIRETLLGHHQETAGSHYDLGVALTGKKDYESALEHLKHAAELQEEVLDTHEELILTHQEMAVVLMELGRTEEAEREMDRAKECAQKLDSLEVPVETFVTHEEKGWQKTDPFPVGST